MQIFARNSQGRTEVVEKPQNFTNFFARNTEVFADFRDIMRFPSAVICISEEIYLCYIAVNYVDLKTPLPVCSVQ